MEENKTLVKGEGEPKADVKQSTSEAKSTAPRSGSQSPKKIDQKEKEKGKDGAAKADDKSADIPEKPKNAEEGPSPEAKDAKRKQSRTPRKPVATPTREHSSRERKSITKLTYQVNTPTPIEVKKGEGASLQEIPRVAENIKAASYKSEILKTIHRFLFGKAGKGMEVKSNVLAFSGIQHPEDEDKEKSRDKWLQRIYRWNTEFLKDVMDLFDLERSAKSFPDGKVDKEKMAVRLLDWLEKPHEVEKTVSSSRKRKSTEGEKKSPKRRKTPKKTPRKSKGDSKDVEEDTESEGGQDDDEEEEAPKKTPKSGKKKPAAKESKKAVKKSVAKVKRTPKGTKGKAKKVKGETDSEEKGKRKKATKAVDEEASDATQSDEDEVNEGEELEELSQEKPEKAPAKKKKPSVVDDEEEPSEKTNGGKGADQKAGETQKGGEVSGKGIAHVDNEGIPEKINEIVASADLTKLTVNGVIAQLEKDYQFDVAKERGKIKKLVQEAVKKRLAA